jgi:GT2 family glycosyltransferase
MSPSFNEVIIIDSSDQGKTLRFPVKNHSIPFFIKNIDLNLARARNLGIRLTSDDSQVVHIIDDDVSLSTDYILNVNIFFENNPTASAVTGLDQSLARNKSMKIRLIRFYCNITKSSGRISRFGFNFGNYSSNENYMIDWMPGCNMIVKKYVFQSVRFVETENLTFCEDLVFGLDLSRKFNAYFCDKILYTHHLSSLNRITDKYKKLQSAKYNLTFLLNNYPEFFTISIIKFRLILIRIKSKSILLKNSL